MNKLFPLAVQTTVLAVLAAKYGADPLGHPVACIFATLSLLVLVRVLFK